MVVSGWAPQAFRQTMEAGPKPIVIAIDGLCLGGGLEIAVACAGRVCSPRSRLGLPELAIGIIPGMGGTQRLPRLVGVRKGVEMMLHSQQVGGEEAGRIGLVDEVVEGGQVVGAAKRMALEIAAGRRARLETVLRTDRLEPLGKAMVAVKEARARVAGGHVRHPELCLDAIIAGVEQGGMAGLLKEKELFDLSLTLDTHKALVHMFFAQRDTKRVKGVTDVGLVPRQMRKVAVVGGGFMGSGICAALLLAGIEVLLKEIDQHCLEAGLGRIRANLQGMVKKGKLKQLQAEQLMAHVTGTLDYNTFGSVDMVIEAALENVVLKQKIFADLEMACRPDCILATNTSAIDIDLVGRDTQAQDRIIGAHFFSPAHLMPLLEIVRGQRTSKQVVVDTLSLSQQIKKTPIVVGNCTGFAVNRVYFPYYTSACFLLDMGLSPYQIDKALSETFGMPFGPFRLMDFNGADVGLNVSKHMAGAFADRMITSNLFPLLNKAGRLGVKTGKGFYKISKGYKSPPDPEAASIIEQSRRAAGYLRPGDKPPKLTDQDIIEMIYFPVVNEGCRVIAEGIVDKPSDLDVASVMGMAFPRYRGGLIFWADLLGAKHVCSRLDEFANRFRPAEGFFRPCAYLRDCAASGRKLGAGTGARSRL
ncbi:unnamed protein product [Ostreobium quekettii]|uniref:Enoyl-CoA hydratase n=1 Tax=Ostreobium quekettii TaxID=121088 RepID=A0A8S1JE70_9CHLO|nr:unnamed protein product [Ostreobium quekettii]